LAKIKALYRRVRENAATAHIFGELVIDTTKRQVLKSGVELALTVKEYDLLVLLAENAGKTLCKDYLFSQVWGSDSFSEPSTLTVHIKWLRGKIECDPGNPEFIVTVWGVGYRFESGS
ncbi:MAG TPA: DNA-binding response regulator, partial [Coriobacteriia bacterium]|nr:DNA-binding response regulator [Coriobacteriia bacterium]